MQFYIGPVAFSVPFDKDNVPALGFVSENAQNAIEEVRSYVQTYASPGFTWGRSGGAPADTWLLNDAVPSNRSGRPVFLSNAVVKKVFVANEDAVILSLDVYHHDGIEIGITLLGTVTTLAQRTNVFDVSYSIPAGKQIGIKISSSSANSGKNIVAGVLITGNIP